MVYKIRYWVRSEKTLAKIPTPQQRRVREAIDKLAHSPKPMGCEKMKGMKNGYRIRVGDYRVVYEIVDQVLIIYVIRVDHRKDVYRRL